MTNCLDSVTADASLTLPPQLIELFKRLRIMDSLEATILSQNWKRSEIMTVDSVYPSVSFSVYLFPSLSVLRLYQIRSRRLKQNLSRSIYICFHTSWLEQTLSIVLVMSVCPSACLLICLSVWRIRGADV